MVRALQGSSYPAAINLGYFIEFPEDEYYNREEEPLPLQADIDKNKWNFYFADELEPHLLREAHDSEHSKLHANKEAIEIKWKDLLDKGPSMSIRVGYPRFHMWREENSTSDVQTSKIANAEGSSLDIKLRTIHPSSSSKADIFVKRNGVPADSCE